MWGAVFQKGMTSFSNLLVCFTLGRMRYIQDRSNVVLGAVNGDPDNCSAYSPYSIRCGLLRPTGKRTGQRLSLKVISKPWHIAFSHAYVTCSACTTPSGKACSFISTLLQKRTLSGSLYRCICNDVKPKVAKFTHHKAISFQMQRNKAKP